MTVQTKHEPLGDSLSMIAPDGTTLMLLRPVIEIDLRARTPLELRLVFLVSDQDWRRIDRGAWFGLELERRSPCFGGGFVPGEPVEITAWLPSERMPLLATPEGRRLLISEVLQASPADSPLRQTESWRGSKVLQPRGRIKAGFVLRTR